jgi:hypothetical protein
MDIPDELWTLIEECWAQLPDKRPSIDSVWKRLGLLFGYSANENDMGGKN